MLTSRIARLTHYANRAAWPNVGRAAFACMLVACLGGCAAQQTLSTGKPYAGAYAKLLPVVEEGLSLGEQAARRQAIVSAMNLVPSGEAMERARALACRVREDQTVLAFGAAQNLDAFSTVVGALATGPDDSLKALAAGLARALPDPQQVLADPAGLRAAEARRVENCRLFANAAVSSVETKSLGPEKQISDAIDVLRKILSVVERERRARAYSELVIALDGPIEANLLELEASLGVRLLTAARAALVGAALNLERGTCAGACDTELLLVADTVDALSQFDRSLVIYQGLYRPGLEDEENVFRLMRAAHKQIVARARGGMVSGPDDIEELIGFQAAIDRIEKQLDGL